ncbi:MAG: hypothetical protein L6Q80_06635 [Dehalococcoidia bacterium]|nr:MAG: hypothetical protein EDM76_11485 [bacterium]MCK6564413.1 hypothetical protein [Dehalococcoidia bacterium]MCL4231838.1 hypothetical protein [Dehalococcoidia bacterium]RIL03358.1 MAG: hypothetical protein DCC78_04835 [bacterium]
MPEFEYQNIEAWNTAIRLATAVGRLKIGSNLKAAADAHQHAFEQAGLACALIAEGSQREGPGQVGMYRDARGALAQARSWLHVLAAVMNEPGTVFGNELDLAEQASRQLGALLRNIERGPAGPRPPQRGGPAGAPPRHGGPPRPPRGTP